MIDLKTVAYRNMIGLVVYHYSFRAGSPLIFLLTCMSSETVIDWCSLCR